MLRPPVTVWAIWLMQRLEPLAPSALREDVLVAATDATRLAVLIDADNTTARLTAELLAEIAKYGLSLIHI